MQKRILIASDIHYACPAEQARRGHEIRVAKGRLGRLALRLFRDYIWLRNPYDQNHLLDQFLDEASGADFVVANGDFTVNTSFYGVADDAACQSVAECLGKLREKFAENFRATIGDHELGKLSLVGRCGGLRLASWRRTVGELGIQPFWRVEMGRYTLIGVASTLLALPVFDPEILPEEKTQWQQLRAEYLKEVLRGFEELGSSQKVLLFCHDPTALPFLWREEIVRKKITQIEQTIIGHLHSPLVFWKSRVLSGMPVIPFLGNSIRRYSSALREARYWPQFNVRLCPSLAGIQLLKDGGYLSVTIDLEARQPAIFERRHIKRLV